MPSFIDLPGNRRIAYHLSDGTLPGVVFLGGFRSDMTGSKATALETFCRARGQRFLRFDYTGHGQSSGEFKDGTIGAWKQDAIDMLTHIAPGQNILVGSSMGGWLMLLAALHYNSPPHRGEAGRGALSEPLSQKSPPPNLPPNGGGTIVALVGIATAPDFTEKLVWDQFTAAQKKELLENGAVSIPDCYGSEPYLLTRQLIEEGRHHLLLDAPIAIKVPVRLLHGTADADVPAHIATTLLGRLTSADATLTLVEGAGHRMSEPDQLALMCQTVASLTNS